MMSINEVKKAYEAGMSLKDIAYCCDTTEDRILDLFASCGEYLDGYSGKINKIRREMGW